MWQKTWITPLPLTEHVELGFLFYAHDSLHGPWTRLRYGRSAALNQLDVGERRVNIIPVKRLQLIHTTSA